MVHGSYAAVLYSPRETVESIHDELGPDLAGMMMCIPEGGKKHVFYLSIACRGVSRGGCLAAMRNAAVFTGIHKSSCTGGLIERDHDFVFILSQCHYNRR